MAWIHVAVDAMGGDNAPDAIVEGAKRALEAYPNLAVTLFGPAGQVQPLIEGHAFSDRLTLVDAPEVIDIHEPPMLAVRRKANSSLVMAMLSVKEGKAGAFVSAGPTGALLAGGVLRLGRIPGIERPALTVILPGRKKPFLLLDCGANVDCQPEYLRLFGLMGSVFMQTVMGVEAPDVRLLNIGAEAEKGNKLSKDAYQLMSAQQEYRFGGNIEAREVPLGDCDVVVCDGFDGNVLLKYTEGLSASLVSMLKEQLTGHVWTKLGALMIKPALRAFKNKLSYQEYGGAPLLGVKGAIIKAHGSSDAITIKNAIRQALTMIEGGIVDKITGGVARLQPTEGDGASAQETNA